MFPNNKSIMKYEIPYEQLSIIGLQPHVVDAMPDEVRSKLENGEMTPIINVKRDINGNIVKMPVKLRMEQGVSGDQELVVYPLNAEMKNSMNLSHVSFQKLEQGEVIHVNGQYLQRDPETNCILKVKDRDLDLEKRLAEIEKVKDIELGIEQKNLIKEGKPVELNVGGEKVSVGLDLRDRDHFKTLNGDMNEWNRQKQIEYDIAHPEFVGLVQTERNRWEYQQIKKEGLNSQSIKESPAQSRSSSMRL